MNTLEVGKRLVDLCRQGKNMQAMDELYSPKIVSIEPVGGGPMPARIEGIQAVRGKSEWWYANHEIHGGTAQGPFPHGNRFIVFFNYEVTAKTGPMAGQRMKIEEGALYTVEGGKIVQEEFFYDMGG